MGETCGEPGLESTFRFGFAGATVAAIGADDGLDELVADDISFREVTEGDSFDAAQCLERLDQSGTLVCRKIDLRLIPSDDRL